MEETRKRERDDPHAEGEVHDFLVDLPPEMFEALMESLSIGEDLESARSAVRSLRATSRTLKRKIDDIRREERFDFVNEALRVLPAAEKWLSIVYDRDAEKLLSELDEMIHEGGRTYVVDELIEDVFVPLTKACVTTRWRAGCHIIHSMAPATTKTMIDEASRTDFVELFFDIIEHLDKNAQNLALTDVFRYPSWNPKGRILKRLISTERSDKITRKVRFDLFMLSPHREGAAGVRFMTKIMHTFSGYSSKMPVAKEAIELGMDQEAVMILNSIARDRFSLSDVQDGDFAIMFRILRFDKDAERRRFEDSFVDQLGLLKALSILYEDKAPIPEWASKYLEDASRLIPSITDLASPDGDKIMDAMIKARDHERIAIMMEKIGPIAKEKLLPFKGRLKRLSGQSERLKMIFKEVFG